VIDDEPGVRRFLRLGLEPHGYEIFEAGTAAQGLALAREADVELIILDLGLPDSSGLSILTTLREWSKVPILILTVRDSEADKVKLLEAGADDYLTKPFSLPELTARLKVALRHSVNEKSSPTFKNDRLVVDYTTRRVFVANQPVKLTVTEYEILRLLTLGGGRIVTQQSLLKDVWGPQGASNVHYLRIYIGSLRKKLEINSAKPQLILTEPGVGYRIQV
jgi:two-component system, OmpR family, KDP operon response regulator KdpE